MGEKLEQNHGRGLQSLHSPPPSQLFHSTPTGGPVAIVVGQVGDEEGVLELALQAGGSEVRVDGPLHGQGQQRLDEEAEHEVLKSLPKADPSVLSVIGFDLFVRLF